MIPSNIVLLLEYTSIALVLAFVPFIHIIIAIRAKKDVEPLHVNLNYSKNPRYMAENYMDHLNKVFRDKNIRHADIIEDERIGIIEVTDKNKTTKSIYDNSLHAINYICILKYCKINHVLSSKETIEIDKECQIGAIKSNKNIIISQSAKIEKWIDSNANIMVGQDSSINIACASGRLMLAHGVTFHRIYASPIQSAYAIRDPIIKYLTESNPVSDSDIQKNLLYLFRRNEKISDKEKIKSSIVSKHSLTLGKEVTVLGDIKSNGELIIGENCTITGNIFSEGDIFILSNCLILGNIFSHKNIYISYGTQIATRHYTKSVISQQKVLLEKNVIVFSYILAVEGGEIV